MLTLEGSSTSFLADWNVAVPAGEESRRIASELAEPFWIAGGENVISMVAGMRGDAEEAERAPPVPNSSASPPAATSSSPSRSSAGCSPRSGTSATTTPTPPRRACSTRPTPAFHPVMSGWLIGDLAEAALQPAASTTAAHLAQIEAMPVHSRPSGSS